MPDYLSLQWFTEAAELVAGSASLAEASAGVHLVVQQTVTSDDADPIVWFVEFEDGRVRLERGAAAAPTITFTCDRATAEGVHAGTIAAQSEFIGGRLRVGGDIAALLAHGEMFAALDDVLAPLR